MLRFPCSFFAQKPVLPYADRTGLFLFCVCRLRLNGVELLCKLGFLSCSSVLVNDVLSGSLIDLFHCQSDSSLGVLGFFGAGSVSLLENGLEVGLNSLVLHCLCSDNFNSLFCGFDVRHNFLSLNNLFFYGNTK